MKQTLQFAVLGLTAVGFLQMAQANTPADVDTVTLRTSCTENNGAIQIPNCFTSMDEVDIWLKTVRLPGPNKPTLVNIGPGSFIGWECSSSNVTLRGAGRDQTIFGMRVYDIGSPLSIVPGCTNLNVQDMTIDGRLDLTGGLNPSRGVQTSNPNAITAWTNVEIVGPTYGWLDVNTACVGSVGKHIFFSTRIRATGTGSSVSRAYSAQCGQAWFWGSQLSAELINNATSAFVLEAKNAEIHLYGSNASLQLAPNTTAQGYQALSNGGIRGHYLMSALQGSEIHIHGTGLDLIHKGSGTADMLYADADPKSHFHATASGFNIHISGTGKVQRLAGPGRIEAPYTWGQNTVPPLSTTSNGVATLISRNGADSYIESDCPLTGNCSLGGTYPHEMIYRANCAGTAINEGPWFDMTTKACRM